MEFFDRAKVFRLKCGHQNKYLVAEKDDETIRQSSNSSSKNAHWSIEVVEGKSNVVRFRSCNTWRYLSTTDDAFLTGMTGKKIAQSIRLGSTVEWEPVKEGSYIKIKNHAAGTFLRANTGIPPWRNSVTHDGPGNWSGNENMVLWIVDIVELDLNSNRGTNKDASVSSTVTPPQVADHVNAVPSSSSSFASQKSSNRPKKSSTESKLKPVQGGLENELGSTDGGDTDSDKFSRCSSVESMTGLAVNVAKITFKELKNKEFHEILSSGEIKRLEKAVNVIVAEATVSGKGTELVNLHERLKSMKKDHIRASKELVECTTFSSKRYEIRAELKKDAIKARELQTVQDELNNTLTSARAWRDELLKQLEETENSIEDAENGEAHNAAEIEELTAVIQQKSEAYKVMENEQKSWRTRMYQAEVTLERVEEEWLKVKDMILNL